VGTALNGLKPRSAKHHFLAYRSFARFRGAASAEYALRELIGLGREEAEGLLDRFQTRELACGRCTQVAGARVTVLRSAVRTLKAAGLTTLSLDRKHGPPPRASYDPAGLVGACLAGLSSKTVREYLPSYDAFARFRGGSVEDALRELIGLGREQAEGLLDRFRTRMKADRYTPRRMARAVAAIRTAVRKAESAGLASFNLDVPPRRRPRASYDPADLVGTCLAGLTSLMARRHLKVYRSFARFRGRSVEDALRELIGLDHDRASSVLADFKHTLEARGLSCTWVATQVTAIKSAVRNLKAAGLTTLSLDTRPVVLTKWEDLVTLQGRGRPFLVLGQQVGVLKTDAQYRVMEAIKAAGSSGIPSATKLKVFSRCESAPRIVGFLRRTYPQLKSRLLTPLKRGGDAYRFDFASEDI
jgi:hypothetical protein